MATRQRVAKEAWLGLLVQAVDKILPIAIVLYLARILAPEQFGAYSFLVAYLALFQVVGEQSLDTVLVRVLSQAPERRVAIFHAALGLRLLVSLAAAALAVAIGGPVSGGNVPLDLLALAALGIVTSAGGAYRALYRAELRIGRVLHIAAVRAVLLAGGVILAVTMHGGIYAVFAATAAANLATFAFVAFAARDDLPFGVAGGRDVWETIARGAFPIAMTALAVTVSLRAGQVILMSLRGPVEVGLLAAASRVTEAFTLLPEALMITVYPLMAGLHERNVPLLTATAGKSARYLVMATGVPVVTCTVAGGAIMRLLFGFDFEQAGPTLGVLATMALLSATGTVIINLLVAVHLERALYRNTLAFAALNVVLCFPAIHFHGYEGAAAVMVLTSIGSQLALALVPATRTLVRTCLGAAGKGFAAVAVATVTGRYSGCGPVAASALALATYLVALVALGVLNREEIAFVRTALTTPAGGPRA